MTLPYKTRRSGPYTLSAGQTGPMSFDFWVPQAADLAVTRYRNGQMTKLGYPGDYTISGIGISGGGSVTLTSGALAGDRYLLEGSKEPARSANFSAGWSTTPDVLNAEGDRIYVHLQELSREVSRAFKTHDFDAAAFDFEGKRLTGVAPALNDGDVVTKGAFTVELAAAIDAVEDSGATATAAAAAASGFASSAGAYAALVNADRLVVEALIGSLPIGAADIFPDTTAGLAAKSEGQYFAVPGAAGSDIFLTLYREVSGVAVLQNTSPSANLATRVNELPIRLGVNLLPFGNFEGGPNDPSRVSNSPVVDLPATALGLLNRGFKRAINWTPGSSEAVRFVPGATEKQHLFGRYFVASFIIESPTFTPPNAYCLVTGDGGALIDTGGTRSRLQIDTNTYLCYHFGQIPAQGTANLSTINSIQNLRIGNPNIDAATDRYATGFSIAFGNTPFNLSNMPPVRQQSPRDAAVLAEQEATAQLVLGPGQSGAINIRRGANLISREFSLKVSPQKMFLNAGLGEYQTFAMTRDVIDGNVFRSMTDDNAPYLVNGGHLGGQHGLGGYLGTATGHGKTSADVGSIWLNGGNQYVLISAYSNNQVLMVRRGASQSAVPTGTFTHVSGAANTANLVITAQTTQGWQPMTSNYKMRVSLDGKPHTKPLGIWKFNRSVVFTESYDVLSFEDAVEWFVTNGNASLDTFAGVNPIFTAVNTYAYDCEGNLAIYANWYCRRSISFTWIYGIQVQHSGADYFYFPNTNPVTHDAVSKNFALIEDAVPMSTELVFDGSNTPAAGPYLERVITMTDDYAFAAGFAPLQDADPAVRRTFVTGPSQGLSISTARKIYLRAVSKGVHTAQPGDQYSWIGYRNVMVRDAERTAAYPVRTNKADFFMIDWHDVTKIDRVPMPPDFMGRDFSVVASRNATVLSDQLTGELLVDVAASGDYAYLQLRVEH